MVDLGQSLRLAREQLLLSQADAAESAEVSILEVEAFETGTVTRLPDQIDTLTALRRYARALHLNGDDYVLAAVEFWPSERRPSWTSERERRYLMPVPSDDDSITGMIDVVAANTGSVPVVEPVGPYAYGSDAPTALKVMVAIVALLVLLGAGALSERSHVSGWYHHSVTAIGNWFGHPTHPPSHPRHVVAAPLPKVTVVNGTTPDSVTINVSAKSFTVKMAAFGYPCWMDVTQVGQTKPLYEQVMRGGDTMAFTITGTDTIRTASGSGRAYVYEGAKFIGYYFPKVAPFTMTFNATG
jgi:transcriptional regulator with XRE-family HTH domain